MALGKLCLTDEALAKKCVPLFVQQLRAAKAPAVRNNIMVALADLCVQYTALVDTHLPRLAACLTDPNELVRRQALALLANLLQKVLCRFPCWEFVCKRRITFIGYHILSQ